MSNWLPQRKSDVLRFVVDQYVTSATPVSSVQIAARGGLGISPATVRNTMAELEDEGYLARPHTSAGGIPSDKAYRYYVASLSKPYNPPTIIQNYIRERLYEVVQDFEEWTRSTAIALSQLVHNLAMVTPPRIEQPRLRQIQVIPLEDLLVLLIVVLEKARPYQQLVSLLEPTPPAELVRTSNKLTSYYVGRTPYEIESLRVPLSALETQITENTLQAMKTEAQEHGGEFFSDGLRHLFRQPEIAHGDRGQRLLELLEQRRLAKIVAGISSQGSVTAIIGTEHPQEALHPYSIIFCPYGLPGTFMGTVAVVGPTRMNYSRTIGGVQYFATLMSDLVQTAYHPR